MNDTAVMQWRVRRGVPSDKGTVSVKKVVDSSLPAEVMYSHSQHFYCANFSFSAFTCVGCVTQTGQEAPVIMYNLFTTLLLCQLFEGPFMVKPTLVLWIHSGRIMLLDSFAQLFL